MAIGLAGLRADVLGGRGAPGVADAPVRPEVIPGAEAPRLPPFVGGAVPGSGHRAAATPVPLGVVVASLEHARKRLPRHTMVRVLPSPHVVATDAVVPVPERPSLQLSTLSQAQTRGKAPGAPAPDTAPPAVSCETIDPGWHADNVSISCSADDTGSGLADQADAAFTLATNVPADAQEPQAATDSHDVCDLAGNCAVAIAVGLAVDRQAPSISCDAPDRSWQPANETIACTATDTGSGLADSGDRHLTLRTTVAADTEDPAAGTGARQVCDEAGNCATAGPLGGLRIDRKSPRLHLTQDPDGAHGWFNHAPAELDAVGQDDQLVRVSCVTAGDRVSGAKTTTVQLATDGAHDVTCTAADEAGNATTATATVQLDTAPPALALATDHPSYGVDDTVTTTCAATDPVSGVSAKDCPAQTAPASSFALGANMITAAATDAAGNRTTAKAAFDVTVSVASLSVLTRRLVSDVEAAAGLVADLRAVEAAPDSSAKAAAVAAYQNDVRALAGTTIGADDAMTLIRLASGL
ncbi:MAG TPA: hypothetical protein VGJ32_17405 [Solirubrobacteraceae bacterium]